MARLHIKYPIGIQDFAKLRQDNWLYVDKTEKVYDLVNNYNYVFLSRPRRFGKSLLLSTISEYFKGNKALFENLAISKLEKNWTVFPVLRVDLTAENYSKPSHIIDKLNLILGQWEKIYGADDLEKSLGARFQGIIERAAKSAGQKVVILVDEYDKPLIDNIGLEDETKEIRDELRGFYSAIKAADEYVRFAMLTGITKFARLSIFSGLNNLVDISLDKRFYDICGITETELEHYFKTSLENFSESNNLSIDDTKSSLKEHYDGYRFTHAPVQGIYNPFSLLNAMAQERLGQYWFQSGTSKFLVDALREVPRLEFNCLEGSKKTETELLDITTVSDDVISILYQTGYLTIKGYDSDNEEYILGFPNLEVYKGFWEALARHYVNSTGVTGFDTRQFVNDLRKGNASKFMERLTALISSCEFGYEANKEVHFQNILAIIFRMIGMKVFTEYSSSRGRADIIIETSSYIYIIELKIDSTPEEALHQIIDKGYAQPFDVDERKTILIGANLSTVNRTIENWLIQPL